MKPSREEIESIIGVKLPEGAGVEYGETAPESSDGVVFDLVCMIKGRFTLYKKIGKTVSFYVFLCGLGLPIPSAYDLTVISANRFVDFADYIYSNATTIESHNAGHLVAFEKKEYKEQEYDTRIQLDDLTIGTGIYPVSDDMLERI